MQFLVLSQTGSEPEPPHAQLRRAASIETGICRFLAAHPASPALLVAQAVWAETRRARPDLHLDSWLWIRERMEQLAAEGRLRREERGGVQVWSVGEPSLKAA
jgi:hypothetical protein